jgi:hypothetical protein
MSPRQHKAALLKWRMFQELSLYRKAVRQYLAKELVRTSRPISGLVMEFRDEWAARRWINFPPALQRRLDRAADHIYI